MSNVTRLIDHRRQSPPSRRQRGDFLPPHLADLELIVDARCHFLRAWHDWVREQPDPDLLREVIETTAAAMVWRREIDDGV